MEIYIAFGECVPVDSMYCCDKEQSSSEHKNSICISGIDGDGGTGIAIALP